MTEKDRETVSPPGPAGGELDETIDLTDQVRFPLELDDLAERFMSLVGALREQGVDGLFSLEKLYHDDWQKLLWIKTKAVEGQVADIVLELANEKHSQAETIRDLVQLFRACIRMLEDDDRQDRRPEGQRS